MKNTRGQSAKETIQCANCWGHQEYANRIVEKSVKYQPTGSHAFILKFMAKYF